MTITGIRGIPSGWRDSMCASGKEEKMCICGSLTTLFQSKEYAIMSLLLVTQAFTLSALI